MSAVFVHDAFSSPRFARPSRAVARARAPRSAQLARSAQPARSAHPPRSAQPRLRITRRGRALLTTLVSAPLVAAGLLFALNGGPAVATGDAVTIPLQTITVETGQTLWGIAESAAPTADPREVIASIMELNRLSSADVFPGQELSLPRSLD
jgi:hypothetical protein